jgi:hypothetical protein
VLINTTSIRRMQSLNVVQAWSDRPSLLCRPKSESEQIDQACCARLISSQFLRVKNWSQVSSCRSRTELKSVLASQELISSQFLQAKNWSQVSSCRSRTDLKSVLAGQELISSQFLILQVKNWSQVSSCRSRTDAPSPTPTTAATSGTRTRHVLNLVSMRCLCTLVHVCVCRHLYTHTLGGTNFSSTCAHLHAV